MFWVFGRLAIVMAAVPYAYVVQRLRDHGGQSLERRPSSRVSRIQAYALFIGLGSCWRLVRCPSTAHFMKPLSRNHAYDPERPSERGFRRGLSGNGQEPVHQTVC